VAYLSVRPTSNTSVFVSMVLIRYGVTSGPTEQVGQESGSDRAEPRQRRGLQVEVQRSPGLLLGHRLQGFGVHGDVDVGADAVVGRQTVLQHAGADLVE
jgi:hypothetical protein